MKEGGIEAEEEEVAEGHMTLKGEKVIELMLRVACCKNFSFLSKSFFLVYF